MRWVLVALGLLFTSVPIAFGARLVDFQVAQPPPVPQDVEQCTIQILHRALFRRDFAFSFGMSEVVQFTPPTECGPAGSWSAITLNFTVTSNGTQFDRLGIFTFQNVEIWRTSTPEPTRGMALFGRTLRMLLATLHYSRSQEGLDGVYSTVLHATFFSSSSAAPTAKQADAIFPLSTFANDTGNDASVPPGFSINVTLPQNAVEVYAELYASGNGEEEFWYSNAPNEFLGSLPNGVTLGQGPFREVRLLVDGMVAGVAFPYAVLFTGAISPAAWRPITSYGAVDLPTYFLDLTPFVPLLTDGQPHNFTIDVASAEDDHTTLQNWFVSGVLQVLVDSSSERTTGNITSYTAEPFADSNAVADIEGRDVIITVTASRQIHIEADILSGSGVATHAVWSQDLQYENVQSYLDNASTQNIKQVSTGTVRSTHNDSPVVTDVFSYPLVINLTNRTTSSGSTNNNTFSYSDTAGNTYERQVNASRNVITLNEESGNLAPAPALLEPPASQVDSEGDFAPARLPGGRRIQV
ncbi:hypothetical protein VNI00_003360 [Paramarasmius palmivorus]|uniref:Peptide N-acetyl-beta-D-glucosaminyl asparaginase amidase A N-terminal domain-containing protein n=1 Tax=Paramarasmius palmivorus TaxID=297713 RepID=A0AAW0DSQ9_9AGAR